MRASIHAAVAHPGAGSYKRAGMATCCDAMAIDARARADATNMGTRSDPMFADMRADPNPQYVDICANGVSCHGCKQRECEE